jgi:hypothetical protein
LFLSGGGSFDAGKGCVDLLGDKEGLGGMDERRSKDCFAMYTIPQYAWHLYLPLLLLYPLLLADPLPRLVSSTSSPTSHEHFFNELAKSYF